MRVAAAAGAAGTGGRLWPGTCLAGDVRHRRADELHQPHAAAGLAGRGFGAADEVLLFLVAVGADEVVEGHGDWGAGDWGLGRKMGNGEG